MTSSAVHWNTDTDLFQCLMRQWRADRSLKSFTVKGCNVYKVPLPVDAEYEIDNYRPMVEGTILLDYVEYEKTT
jgi:hypothetical protein